MKKISPLVLWPCITMLAFFLAAVLFRPLLPIDETRYMTVAWEMRLNNGWFAPLTLNLEPYSHKPPMLFWLINLSWSIFGVSRWAGLIPVVLASLSCVFLTVKLGDKLIPAESFDPEKTMWIMLGSIPFFIYSTLVMFDTTMMMFVLCALLCLIIYAQERKFRYMFLLGIFTGLALLTKGPVAWLYIIFPMLLGPLWVQNFAKPLSWYADCFAGLLISVFPLLAWLIPVLSRSDNHFAFWLLWEQTAGRVTGNFKDAHIRPWYFYLPLIPAIFMPWIFFPAFWRSIKKTDAKMPLMRFILCWIVPVFLSFSLISGKQPHYLVPLLPGIFLIVTMLLNSMPIKVIKHTACTLIMLGIFGQVCAAFFFFHSYNLQPVASYVETHQNKDWAWVRNYHGEIGFMGRLRRPLTNIDDKEKLAAWFTDHPDGLAVIRYSDDTEVAHLKKVTSSDYRGRFMGVFASGKTPELNKETE